MSPKGHEWHCATCRHQQLTHLRQVRHDGQDCRAASDRLYVVTSRPTPHVVAIRQGKLLTAQAHACIAGSAVSVHPSTACCMGWSSVAATVINTANKYPTSCWVGPLQLACRPRAVDLLSHNDDVLRPHRQPEPVSVTDVT
jgi:hypothetical protein